MHSLSPRLLRSLLVLSAALILVPIAPQLAQAQSSPPTSKAPPPPPPPPATDQQQFVSYWTTETGWRTELQLRNNQVGQILTVTPVLRATDGTETPLFPVVIQPHEVKTVDVATAIGSSAPQLIGAYGSLTLRYRAPSQINLYAAAMVMGVGHSIAFHVDATGEDQTENVGSREGIWWLPSASANDYLVLTNQGQNPLQLALSLYDASGKASTQNFTLPPRGMNRLSVRQLLSAAMLASSYGGIKVSAVNHAGSLDTLHALFDQDAGFSAVMKMFFYDPRSQIAERDYAKTGQWTLRAPMLALSNPDRALAFPVGTVLQPQLFVRNTTSKPIDAALNFNWRTDTTIGKASGPTLHLVPYETRRIDVAALQDGKTLPQNAQWASVTMATTALPDEVVAVAASYDQALHFGAQTPFSDQLAIHWVGGQWNYDAQHDSIITAGNGGTKPTQTAFTIFYTQGTQRYELEQTLQPGEQMWMDIGKLIRESVPDKNGKTLPADLTTGSYEVRDLTNKGVGTLFEGKVIYDKTYGHVVYGCAACCGWTIPFNLWYDPISVIITSFQDDGVTAWYPCESQYDDVSTSFYGGWSSGAPSIVTVDTYGTHTGVAVGSTTSQAHGCVQSNNAHLDCPNTCPTPIAPANVATLSCTPSSVTRGSSVTCSVSGAPTGATFSSWKFTDSSNNTVTGSGTSSSWSGMLVTSGTVSVQVSAAGSNPSTPTASVTVTNRNWHTAPASPAEAANGTFITLPVPPQNTGTDSGLGYFAWHYVLNSGSQGLQYSTINDNGLNQGYTYWPANQIFSTWNFQYEINPDLENTASTFYQEQCGKDGWILGSSLLTQTNRHEWNSSTQSHYALYSISLNSSSNNPGDFLEQQIASPGANLTTFAQNSTSGINNRLSTVTSASGNEAVLYPVNYSESGTFLGNINYGPSYGSCN
jgi:hypothetical protein